MNTLRTFAALIVLLAVASPAHGQTTRPCPSQYGVYYKSAAGWTALRPIVADGPAAKQPDNVSRPSAPVKVTDHRPMFCIRQPVGSLGGPEKPDPVVLIRLDEKKATSQIRNYAQEQVVPTHLARADEEGLFTISSTSDLSTAEYSIILGSQNGAAYEFVVR
jgi:hypothetical protein